MFRNLNIHKIVALVTTAVMIWNIAGWLGAGLVLNHAHHGSDSHTCEIAFCYCETEGDETVCSCHHHDLNNKNEHHTDSDNTGGACYFTDGHTPQTAASQLTYTSNVTGYYFFDRTPIYTLKFTYLPEEPHKSILSGISPDLLRPPRV